MSTAVTTERNRGFLDKDSQCIPDAAVTKKDNSSQSPPFKQQRNFLLTSFLIKEALFNEKPIHFLKIVILFVAPQTLYSHFPLSRVFEILFAVQQILSTMALSDRLLSDQESGHRSKCLWWLPSRGRNETRATETDGQSF